MNEISPSIPRTEISLADLKDPRSILNLVPQAVADAISEVLFEHPDLFEVDEHELYKKLGSHGRQPNPTDNRLRLKFWDEYDRVQASGAAKMNMVSVLSGICSREMFYKKYLKQPTKLAWLVCPPTGYMIKAEEALEFGIEQLRELLDFPNTYHGKVDTKLGELKLKIVAMLDMRVKGAVIQKSMNLHASVSNQAVAKAAEAATEEDLMRQLEELEKKNRKAQNLPEPSGKVVFPDIEIS